jgi:putative restriction endonuclease
MTKSRRGEKWTREEHLLVFNLYYQIPFGSMDRRNPHVIELSKLMHRDENSIALKLSNFARFDPVLKARGIKGMSHGAKGEGEVWQEFNHNPELLLFESEQLLAKRKGQAVEKIAGVAIDDLSFVSGKEREALVKIRVNQSLFRKRILSAYDYRCCVTGLEVKSLLVASHIIPWSKDKSNRLNAKNGLCLNSLHDRAFDRGLMWVDQDFTIRFSSRLKKEKNEEALVWLKGFEGRKLILPKKFSPDPDLLKRHAKNCC